MQILKKLGAFPVFLILLLSFTRPLLPVEQVSTWEWRDVDRVVAVGDVHGTIDSLKKVLTHSGLVDESLSWNGGESHLVFCGDLIGRGEYEKDVLDLVMKLEIEALQTGGMVHAILGNHDTMSLARNLHYVHPRNYADYVDVERPLDRQSAWQGFLKAHAGMGASEGQIRSAFDDRYPPGFFGRLQAFSPEGVYGSWLIKKPMAIKINDVIFVHGGIAPTFAGFGLDGINQHLPDTAAQFFPLRDRLSEQMGFPLQFIETQTFVDLILSDERKGDFPEETVETARQFQKIAEDKFFDTEGPHWYRGYALNEEALIDPDVKTVFEKLGARHMVLGHTPSRFGRISSRLQSRILRIDVGMVYNKKVWGFLEYEGGEFKAMGFRNPSNYVFPYEEPPGGEDYSSIMEQLPPKQLESYLRRGKILGMYDEILTADGRTLPVYEMEYKDQKERAVFNSHIEMSDGRNPPERLRSYKHMVAAYRISRILEYNIVPTTIIRKHEGREGSFALFPGNAVNRQMFETEEQVDEITQGLEQELSDARAFLALLDIEGQDYKGRMLHRKERRLILADLTKGFSESPEIREEFFTGANERWLVDRPLDPFLELKLRELNAKELRQKCKGLLSDGQINALLARRDALLTRSAKLAQK
jgi:hypothetical protein